MRRTRSTSPGNCAAHLVEEAAVDLVDDLQVPRQRLAEQAQRPLLQRLGQQRVVGVAEGRDRDRPGLVPVEPPLVDQDPHQLGDADRRVGVVELRRRTARAARAATASARSSMMCTTCCSEHDTKKYCCSSRSRLPASGSSFG